MAKITITLTAYNMGNVTEADFDAWARYVDEHVSEACGVEVLVVDQFAFGASEERDVVTGATDEQEERILDWLAHEGWGAFCADTSAWPAFGIRRMTMAKTIYTCGVSDGPNGGGWSWTETSKRQALVSVRREVTARFRNATVGSVEVDGRTIARWKNEHGRARRYEVA